MRGLCSTLRVLTCAALIISNLAGCGTQLEAPVVPGPQDATTHDVFEEATTPLTDLATNAVPSPGNILLNPTLGAQRILVVRVSYPDDNSPTLQPLPNTMPSTWTQAFTDNSYGKAQYTFKTVELTMPQNTAYYSAKYQGPTRLRADIIKMLTLEGIDPNEFTGEMILSKKVWTAHPNHFAGWNRRTTWVSTGAPDAHTVTHEWGHVMGFAHANLWDVATGLSPSASAGESIEYYDYFDPMGGSGMATTAVGYEHYNPWFKWRLGWLDDTEVPTITSSGSYVITNLDHPSSVSGPRALRIRQNPDRDYYVFRRGNDPTASGGVLLTWAKHFTTAATDLLDMTPGSKSTWEDWQDAALLPGQSHYDAEAGATITLVATTATTATVQVTFDPGVDPNAIDRLPILDVVQPSGHETISGSMTVAISGYDPDVGTFDGAGLARLDAVVLSALTQPATPLKTFTRSSPGQTWQMDVSDLASGPYVIAAVATDLQGKRHTGARIVMIDNEGPSF